MEECTLTKVWSYFPSCQLQECIPHSYGILFNNISMRLKILMVSSKFIVGSMCMLPDLFSAGMLYSLYIISSTSCYLCLQIQLYKQQYIKYRDNF